MSRPWQHAFVMAVIVRLVTGWGSAGAEDAGVTVVVEAQAVAADQQNQDQQNKDQQNQEQQQAQQIEQMLQPLVHAELEFIRSTCGDLAPEAKREIRAAAMAAVREFSGQFVAEQQRPGRRSLEMGPTFAKHLDQLIDRHLRPDAVAAWHRERDARRERRAETSRLLIVAKLDEALELTAAQREAILAGLRADWKEAWLCELTDVGGFAINGLRPAPDYAAAAITPHLDDRQRRTWDEWAKAAGWRRAGVHLGWRFPDGPGLRGADPWWVP